MKTIIRLFTAVFVLLLFVYSPAGAQEWKLDKDHSGFYFDVNHIYSTIRGNFNDFSGQVFFAPNNLAASKVAFEIKVKSIDTNNRKRDGHLITKDFFLAKSFPVISFVSDSITHFKGNAYMVTGELKIKDVAKRIELPMTFRGTKPHPFNPKETVAGLDSRLTINRLDYHVGTGQYYEMGVVGKDVDITMSLELIR